MTRLALLAVLLNSGGAAVARTPALHVESVHRLTFGSGLAQLGRERPSEGSAEGPASLVVDGSGRVFVLDQVNRRLLVLTRGASPWTVALPDRPFRDVTLDGSGGFWLLDAIGDTVVRLDAAGHEMSRLTLAGPLLDHAMHVTSLHRADDGLYVEIMWLYTVKIGDVQGQALVERSALPGRPVGPRGSLRAALAGRAPTNAVNLTLHPAGRAPHRVARLDFDDRVMRLDFAGLDHAGAWVAVRLGREDATPSGDFEVTRDREVIVALEPNGVERARTTLPRTWLPDDQPHPVTLGGDGALWALFLDEAGGTVWRVSR